MKSTALTIPTKVATTITEKAQSITITSTKQLTEAATFREQAKKALKTLTLEKEKVTKPLAEALKQERMRFAPLEDMLNQAINMINSKMTTYQTEVDRIARLEEAKIALQAESGRIRPDTAIRKMSAIEQPESAIITDSGTVKFRTTPKFEVTDVSKLPPAYLLPNEVLIRRAMLAGIQIDGVRYYEEKTPISARS